MLHKDARQRRHNGHNCQAWQDHNTPLYLAAWGGFVNIAEMLIEKGADIEAEGYVSANAPTSPPPILPTQTW